MTENDPVVKKCPPGSAKGAENSWPQVASQEFIKPVRHAVGWTGREDSQTAACMHLAYIPKEPKQ